MLARSRVVMWRFGKQGLIASQSVLRVSAVVLVLKLKFMVV